MSWHSAWTTSYWPLGNYDSVNVQDNATEVYNQLTGAGWTHNAAVACIGNLIHESTGINPGQFEGGKGYSWQWGFGIAQWTPGTKVSNYIGSQAQGVVDNGSRQLDFLLNTPSQWSTYYLNPDGTSHYYGLSGLPYITSMAAFAASTAPVADLVAVYMVCWERPSAAYAGLSTRQQYAAYYDNFFGGSPAPGTFRILVSTIGNGTAYASPATAAPGDTITLHQSAGDGDSFIDWTVLSGGITIVNNQFVMPSQNVQIRANFTGEAPSPSEQVYYPIWLYYQWGRLRRKITKGEIF